MKTVKEKKMHEIGGSTQSPRVMHLLCTYTAILPWHSLLSYCAVLNIFQYIIIKL